MYLKHYPSIKIIKNRTLRFKYKKKSFKLTQSKTLAPTSKKIHKRIVWHE